MEEKDLLEHIDDRLLKFVQAAKEENSGLLLDIKNQLSTFHDSILLLQGDFRTMVSQNGIRNGRIEKSENRINTLSAWKYMLVAGISVIAFLFPVFQSMYNDKIDSVKDLLAQHIDSTDKIQTTINK